MQITLNCFLCEGPYACRREKRYTMLLKILHVLILIIAFLTVLNSTYAQTNSLQDPSHVGDHVTAKLTPTFRVVAYYSGPTDLVDSFEIEKITHLIFCF